MHEYLTLEKRDMNCDQIFKNNLTVGACTHPSPRPNQNGNNIFNMKISKSNFSNCFQMQLDNFLINISLEKHLLHEAGEDIIFKQ